jgi:hypothetical protein
MKKSKKLFTSAGALALLLLTPLYFTHAQSITFSKDSHGNWEFNSGFHDNSTYHALITSDGRGNSGIDSDLTDTSISSLVNMEVFVADTNGAGFSDTCSSPNYTGNPTVDLSCYAAAARSQNFPYAIGQSWQTQSAAATDPSPCKCP